MSLQSLPVDERRIISALLNSALSAGFVVSVYDGEEWALSCSDSLPRLADLIAATDCTTLRFRDPATLNDSGKPSSVGSVFLVHGNGADVISDYSDNSATRALIGPASAIADEFSGAV